MLQSFSEVPSVVLRNLKQKYINNKLPDCHTGLKIITSITLAEYLKYLFLSNTLSLSEILSVILMKR